MTLGWIAWLLPIIELGAAARLASRVWRKPYRILLAFLLVEAVSHILLLLSIRWRVAAWLFGQPVRMAVRALATLEVLHRGCVPMTAGQRWRAVCWVMSLSLLCCGFFEVWKLSPMRSFVLFREFFHLILAAALLGLCIHLHREPIAENPDHRYSRLGMTAAMVLLAAAGTFVPNGLGYMIFPYTMQTWRMVDRIQYVAMMVVIVWMAWGMTSNISCFRPEVAERHRRKRRAAASGAWNEE
jgi:hypothetical protein